jgi:ABC-type Mn2+/Zn2+ transport system permease subunit
MIDALLEPWREPILRTALAEVVFAGLACAVLGVWVVLLGRSYTAESLAHGMFPGLVAAALVGVPLALGGAAGLVLAALAIAFAARARGVGADNAVAVVIATLFGAGGLLALSPDTPPGLHALLFGDVLATGGADLALAGVLAAAVLGGSWLVHWRLLAVGFDPLGARGLGVRPVTAEVALALLLALAVLVGVRGLGNLLVVAALIGPAAAARTFTRRVAPMMAAACALGTVAGVAGIYLSYYAGLAAGAAISGLLVSTAAVCILASRGLSALRASSTSVRF